MRICVLSRGVPDVKSPLNGKYEWSLAVTLSRIGYEVIVIAVDLRIGKKRKKTGLNKFFKEGVEVWDYGLPIGKLAQCAAARLRLAVIAKAYAALMKEGRPPDLTWAFFGRIMGSVAKNIKQKYDIPFVIGEYESRLIEGLPEREKEKLTNIYREATALTAPNGAFCDRLTNMFGREFNFLPQRKAENSQKTEHEGFVFISIGALSIERGMDLVIRAFSRVKKGNSHAKLVIVGTGDEKNYLVDQVKALFIEDSVEFRSPREKSLESYISESDCFVIASRKDTFGTTYTAALCAGIPIITTECFAAKSIIPDFAGKIVPQEDWKALAGAMAEAAEPTSPYSSERIREFADNTFSTHAIAEKIENILSKKKESMPAQDIF